MEDTQTKNKLFIGSLNSKPNHAVLLEHFEQFGEVSSLQLVKHHKYRSQCAGFGFVTYKTKQAAEKCLKSTHRHQGRDLILKVGLKGGKLGAFQENLFKRRFFVGNLAKGTRNHDLENYFS